MPSDTHDKVFICYSHVDKDWLAEIKKYLTPFRIQTWSDTDIKPGDEFRKEIEEALASAEAAILLVSPDFLASDFIQTYELPMLLNAAKKGLKILWIPIRASSYEENNIATYQAVWSPDRPLKSLSVHKREKALVEICKEISKAVANPR
jgi:internalin A